MTNLLVPTFMWFDVPVHQVTSLLVIPPPFSSSTPNLVVTGSNTGNLCLWESKQKGPGLIPRIFVASQDCSPVVALFCLLHESRPTILSVTLDGTVALYALSDGQCLAARANALKCTPKVVKLFENKFLIAGGKAYDVEILDLITRRVIHRIERHNTWIRDISMCVLKETQAVGVLTGAGEAIFWSAPAELKNKKSTHSDEILVKPFELPDSIAMNVSPSNTLLLVLYNDFWEIYEFKVSKVLARVRINTGESIIGGHFLDDHQLILWTTDGKGAIYKLPEEIFEQASIATAADTTHQMQSEINAILFSSDFGGPSKPPPSSQPPVEEKKDIPYLLDTLDPAGYLQMSGSQGVVKSVQSIQYTFTEQYYTVAFDEGHVCSWDFPLKDIEKTVSSPLLPNSMGDIKDGWDEPEGPIVTSSLILESVFMMITGHDDGSITLRKLPTDTQPIKWSAHLSRINCMLHIKTNLVDYLITGSDDYYVKMWSLSTQRMIARFSCHSGPVRAFYAAENPISEIWNNRFFSVSDDRSVILYQMDEERGILGVFGSHPYDIADVKWNVEQGYLFVSCVDGSVSVWEMDTGVLEQRVHGKVASDILSNALPLAKLEKQEKIHLSARQSITSITIDGQTQANKSPVQSLVLNIKCLSADQKNQQNNLYNSYLFPWGHEPALDAMMRTELNLSPPNPPITYGIIGSSGRMSILVPKTDLLARWKISDTMTALHALSIVSLCHPSLTQKYTTNAHGQILSYICALLPDQVDNYISPSLSYLARYYHDSMENIMETSRTIICSVIDKLNEEGRKSLVQTWFSQLYTEENPKNKDLDILVLGIIGSERPDVLPETTVKVITNGILNLLFQEGGSNEKLRVAAMEILGKGFGKWKSCLDPYQLIMQLIKLHGTPNQSKPLADKTQLAILLIGKEDPILFLKAILRPITQAKMTDAIIQDHLIALQFLGLLIKKYPSSLLPALPTLAQVILRSLTPNQHNIRTTCLTTARNLISDLVHKFPMVAFHAQSQRLAVGARDGSLTIFDLVSATLCHTIEKAHPKEVTALSWDPEGEKLASYSIEEQKVKVWDTKTNYFGILGTKPTSKKAFDVINTRVVPIDQLLDLSTSSSANANSMSSQFRFSWTSKKSIVLARPWEPQDKVLGFEM